MIAFIFWISLLGIFYTYIGYPLLLGLLAHLRPQPMSLPPIEPTVTVLIAAYNEEKSLAKKLENSLALDYPQHKLQILVAAHGSNDGTVEIAQNYAARGVELSYKPERNGKMAAINHAMQKARGEIIVMSDANNLYETETLRAILGPFANPKVGVTCGNKVILKSDGALGASEGVYWKYEAWIKKQETRLGCTTGVLGELLAFRRGLFERPPDDIINDDFYLALRIARHGYNIIYVPEARSFEHVSLTAQDEITRRTRIVAGRFQAIARAREILSLQRPLLLWQVTSHKFMRPLVPIGMILAFASNLLLVIYPPHTGFLTPPWNRVFFGLQLAFYFLAWLGNLLKIKLLYIPTFLFNSNFAALKGLLHYLSGKQSAAWTRVQRRE